MPSINKNERIIQRVQTQQGEITINLNLSITVEGKNISVGVQSVEEQPKRSMIKAKEPVIIPEEQFDLEIPVLDNFGKKS